MGIDNILYFDKMNFENYNHIRNRMAEKSEIDRIIQKYRFNTIKVLLSSSDEFWDTIEGIKIIVQPKCLRILYNHVTDQYNLNDYCLHDESENEDIQPQKKNSRLEFGYKDGDFYISGKTPIRVYSKRETPNLPTTYSKTYEELIDEDTQTMLIENYISNKNIPEWLIIAFFKSLKCKKTNISTLISELCFD